MSKIGFTRLQREDELEDTGINEDEVAKELLLEESTEESAEEPLTLDNQMIGIFSDINEETAAEVIHNLLLMKAAASTLPANSPKSSVDFYISTNGGTAHDMFAVYDIMRMVREHIDICTIGVGKVMSAGTLLLAAGTKGKRKIGKNCRVMIHDVIGGHVGPMTQLKNEMKEITHTQKQYAASLVGETTITSEYMKIILERGVNSYLSAEEALKMGIVDEIF
jgi:ATP-dependent Clp protease protease subunit